MPIWFETVALMLAAYGIGLAIGWAFWGRKPEAVAHDHEEKEMP